MTIQYIPMVSYTKALCGDAYAIKEQRQIEGRKRHWNCVHWIDENGTQHVTEFGVVTEMMPDFCGGLMVYSPYVTDYNKTSGWSSVFANPGMLTEGEEVLTDWKDFDPAKHAVDLCAYTGESFTKPREVKEYLIKCIAAQVAGEMAYTGRHGFVMSDRIGGMCSRLYATMLSMGSLISSPAGSFHVSEVGAARLRAVTCGSTYAYKVSFWGDEGTSWYNANSGNAVHWLSGGFVKRAEAPTRNMRRCDNCDFAFDVDVHDTCPECGCSDYWNDDDLSQQESLEEADFQFHESLKVMQGSYPDRARRFFWRNG